MSRKLQVLGLAGIGLVVVLAGLFMWGVGVYNGLVSSEAEVDESWAQVENVLQRRYDLIPNLVSSVEGSMEQEREIFTSIAESRQMANNASGVEESSEANADLSNNLQTLVNVIKESYPELNSNKNVQALMAQLEGTENRISVERKRFNETVTDYNVQIKQLPTSLVAPTLGYTERELFEMEEGAETAPEVDFDLGG